MTFRKYLISELSKAKKYEKFAHSRNKKAIKETGSDICDSIFYALEISTQLRLKIEQILEMHRKLEKGVKK